MMGQTQESTTRALEPVVPAVTYARDIRAIRKQGVRYHHFHASHSHGISTGQINAEDWSAKISICMLRVHSH